MPDLRDIFSGPGNVRARMRERNWAASPLGPAAIWPAALHNVLQLILDSRFPMCVGWGEQLCLLYNDAYGEILGARHPSSLGRPFWEVWPEIRGEIGPDIERALAGEAVFVENQPLVLLRFGAAEQTWFTFSISPQRDDDGRIAGIYAVCTETTGAMQAGVALRDAEQRLQLALEAGAMGAWHWNLQTGEARWLSGMAVLHGLPPGTALCAMEEYETLIHPDDRAFVKEAVARAVRERRDHRVEYRIVRPDGGLRWIEGRGRLFLDEDGNPRQMAGVCMDITRRRTVEQDSRFLAQASMELAHLVDARVTMERLARLAVPSFSDWCAIDILQDDGTLQRIAVAHVDPHKVALAQELHRRFPPDPSLPRGTWTVLRSGQAELIPEITDALLAESLHDPEHLAAIRSLGLKSYIGVPLKTKGKVLGVVCFVSAESGRSYEARDLALAEDLALRAAIAIENADLYQAVREADRRKDVFLATLSHELRNPLAPISTALGVMKLAQHDPARMERSLRMMERQVGQMTRLVDDLMDVSRISAGKMDLRKQRVNLSAILHNAVETSRPHIEAAHHQLILNLPGVPMELQADPVRLAQVFANLLNNAAKYTRPGGRIELSAECIGHECMVRVKDNGIGIPREMLRNIFSTFTQERGPSEYSQGGLGIGLSLVEGIVALHGGRVEAHSEGSGRGSEFLVRLPCAENAAQDPLATAGRAGGAGPGSGRRVLVVDDNVDAANTVAELLQLLGHEVVVAHGGREALDRAREMKPEVVLLDIGLPDIDGYETARRLRAGNETRNARLIALTGWGQDKDKQQSAQAGFDRHWVKPVGLEQLRQVGAI